MHGLSKIRSATYALSSALSLPRFSSSFSGCLNWSLLYCWVICKAWERLSVEYGKPYIWKYRIRGTLRSHDPGDECFLDVRDNNDIREYTSIHQSSKPSDRTDHAHTAGATTVHQVCHIGSFSFIGGGSVVSQDVTKYMIVSGERTELRGLNLEGL